MSTRSEPGALAPPGFVPLSVPQICGNEWAYVKECLDTGWVSSVGSFVDRFERSLADRVGSPFAVATVNGTAALHVALLVCGVGLDDEVLVPALTFVAPANAVRYANAHPVFVDVEPRHYQMDTAKAVDFLERGCAWRDGALRNRVSGRRIAAVLPVHLLGHPVDLDPVLELTRKYGIAVVEDATESLGASYKGRPTGTLGDAGCFSFNGNKIITSGGGGMIVTRQEALARKARYLTTQAKDDAFEYVHNEVGFNYRLTNVLAAIGLAQLERLDVYAERKRTIAARYSEALSGLPGITRPVEADWARSIFWLYTVLVDERTAGVSSRALSARLRQERIESRPFWHPIHRLPPFAGCQAWHVEVADALHRDGLSLPSSTSLTEADQRRVIDAVESAVGAPRASC